MMDYLINMPDMKSIAASDRLQNIIEHCIKVHNAGSVGKRVNNSATVDVRSPIMTQIVCRGFQVEWCNVSPGPPIGGLLVFIPHEAQTSSAVVC